MRASCSQAKSSVRNLALATLLLLNLPHVVLANSTMLDPATQPKFVNEVPDALAPGFIFAPVETTADYDYYQIGMYQVEQPLGLVDPMTGEPLLTKVWGYGTAPGFPNATYPGRTFIMHRDRQARIRWSNNLTVDGTETGAVLPHLLPVDETLHWALSLPGYDMNSIAMDGVPVVPHVHGGHTEWQSDGNPEYWFTPGYRLKGPRWVKDTYVYDNDQQAGTIWYHDHGLGITRLNVYAGLAGFFIIRDEYDTGLADNPVGLPVHPYEKLLAIQDHMFDSEGQHFYPAFPGDPMWDEFIGDNPLVNGPSALAEFFGDFILVNGVPWPKMEVEPRVYRLRLLNGSDSRFYQLRLAGGPEINVIGTDNGLLSAPIRVDQLVMAPGERYDVLIDFTNFAGQRLILRNRARSPFPAGETTDPNTAGQIMAFDVGMTVSDATNNSIPTTLRSGPITPDDITQGDEVARTRQLALFEGMDNLGRLQPLLGLAAPAMDVTGEMQDGSLVWSECVDPITENPMLDDVEIWEVYNATGDAHPFHVHLVSFQILGRQKFKATLLPKEMEQHDGTVGEGFTMTGIAKTGVERAPAAFENGWKDTAIMYPGEVTRIMARFDRPGRYVYHCHILSHEDHEMMRAYHVGPWDPHTDLPYDCDGHLHRAAAGEENAAANAGDLALAVTPNPFNPSAEFAFAVPQGAHVHLVVYDLRGRVVRVLADGEHAAGEYRLTWNGQDDQGARVASGTYFARLESGEQSVIQKIVMLK